LVPMGRKFAATTPSRTLVPEAVIKGVSSVCHAVEEYAVTTTETVRKTRSGPLKGAMERRLDPWEVTRLLKSGVCPRESLCFP